MVMKHEMFISKKADREDRQINMKETMLQTFTALVSPNQEPFIQLYVPREQKDTATLK